MWRLNYVPTLFLIYKLAVGTCSKSFDYEWVSKFIFRARNLFTEKVLRSLLCNFPQVQNHVPKIYVYITLQTYSDIIHTKLHCNEHMCPSPVGPRIFFAFFSKFRGQLVRLHYWMYTNAYDWYHYKITEDTLPSKTSILYNDRNYEYVKTHHHLLGSILNPKIQLPDLFLTSTTSTVEVLPLPAFNLKTKDPRTDPVDLRTRPGPRKNWTFRTGLGPRKINKTRTNSERAVHSYLLRTSAC